MVPASKETQIIFLPSKMDRKYLKDTVIEEDKLEINGNIIGEASAYVALKVIDKLNQPTL